MLPGPRHSWAHYHGDVIDLLLPLGVKKGVSALWYSELSQNQLDSDQHSLYSDGQHTLAFYIKCVPLVGLLVLLLLLLLLRHNARGLTTTRTLFTCSLNLELTRGHRGYCTG